MTSSHHHFNGTVFFTQREDVSLLFWLHWASVHVVIIHIKSMCVDLHNPQEQNPHILMPEISLNFSYPDQRSMKIEELSLILQDGPLTFTRLSLS